jgi:hypothetical protein
VGKRHLLQEVLRQMPPCADASPPPPRRGEEEEDRSKGEKEDERSSKRRRRDESSAEQGVPACRTDVPLEELIKTQQQTARENRVFFLQQSTANKPP